MAWTQSDSLPKKNCNPNQPDRLGQVGFGELAGRIDWIFQYSQPAKKGVGYKSTKQTEHERGAKEVGDCVGRGSVAQMHGSSQIGHQIDSNTQRC